MEDQYLGDGVYASFDGFGIVLDLRAQDNTTRVVLEPATFKALVLYEQMLRQRVRPKSEQKESDDGRGKSGRDAAGNLAAAGEPADAGADGVPAGGGADAEAD